MRYILSSRVLVSAALAVAAIVLLPSLALAFHEADSFARSANTGGGNDRYYSGSPRSKAYECSICHVGAEGRIAIELVSPLRSGVYTPGLIYPIELRLIGEHRGLDSAFNPNTFTAELTDELGRPVGRWAAGSDSVVELRDQGTVAIAEGFGNGESSWSFSWWAPEEGGAATLYVAMLDGDGASDKVTRFIDPLHDDVATLRLPLCPVDEKCSESPATEGPGSPAGCSSTGGADPGAGMVLLLLVWLATRLPTSRWRSSVR